MVVVVTIMSISVTSCLICFDLNFVFLLFDLQNVISSELSHVQSFPSFSNDALQGPASVHA